MSSRRHSHSGLLASENMVEGMPWEYCWGTEILTIL